MRLFQPQENREKILKLTIGALGATVFLFLSYLLAVLHRLEMMKEVYKDIPQEYVIKDITSNIRSIFNNVSIFETLTYFLIAVCVVVLIYTGYCAVINRLSHRRKSSLNDVPQDFAELLNETVLDPVGLYKTIIDRITEAQKRSDSTDTIVLDYLFLLREGIFKPRTKSPYQKALLTGIIENSHFSDKVKEIEYILNNATHPDPLKYRTRYSELEKVYNRFVIKINTSKNESTGNQPEF